MMDSLRKLFNQIYEELKAIDVNFLEFCPEHLLISSGKFQIYKLHLLPSETANIGQVVYVVIVSACWLQVERNLS